MLASDQSSTSLRHGARGALHEATEMRTWFCMPWIAGADGCTVAVKPTLFGKAGKASFVEMGARQPQKSRTPETAPQEEPSP